MSQPPTLLIVGASTRAAAQSAVRGGMAVICADMFADADLRAIAQVLSVDRYPHDLPAAIRLAPDAAWMYTGALENHAKIVQKISREKQLLGNSAEVLKRVRNPFCVNQALAKAGLPTLEVRHINSPPKDGRWMLKSRRSAGGSGVASWEGDRAVADMEIPPLAYPAVAGSAPPASEHSYNSEVFQYIDSPQDDDTCRPTTSVSRQPNTPAPLNITASAPSQHEYYLQARCDGQSASAVFLATPRETILIGISQQLIGLSEMNAGPYAYCGSIGPWRPAADIETQIQDVGKNIALTFQLRGLFGCDFILDERAAWLTEVNPRYPASAEIFEYALQRSLVEWHCRACAEFDAADEPASSQRLAIDPARNSILQSSQSVFGKMILYADRDFTAPRSMSESIDKVRCGDFRLPTVADIPPPGTRILAGQPVCTVLAQAHDREHCRRELQKRVSDVRRQLGLDKLSALPGTPQP